MIRAFGVAWCAHHSACSPLAMQGRTVRPGVGVSRMGSELQYHGIPVRAGQAGPHRDTRVRREMQWMSELGSLMDGGLR